MSGLCWKKVLQVVESTSFHLQMKKPTVSLHTSEHAATILPLKKARLFFLILNKHVGERCLKKIVLHFEGTLDLTTQFQRWIYLFCFSVWCQRHMILSVFIILQSEFTLTLYLSQTARCQICPLPNDLFIQHANENKEDLYLMDSLVTVGDELLNCSGSVPVELHHEGSKTLFICTYNHVIIYGWI